MNITSRRRHAVVIPFIVTALLTSLWLLLSQRESSQVSLPKAESITHGRTTAPSATRPPRLQTEPRAAELAIAAVTVEKEEVCEGESNLVTVELAGAGAKDARVLVGHVAGTRVPLRLRLGQGGVPHFPDVTVMSADGTVVIAPVPAYRVKRCEAPLMAEITPVAVANADETHRFAVRLLGGEQGQGSAPSIAEVEWDFGDGRGEVTSVAEVTHDFSERPQTHLFTYQLVSARVRLRDGRELAASTSVELMNYAAHVRRQGGALIVARSKARFATPDAAGVIVQTVDVRHFENVALAIESVTVESTLASGQTDRKQIAAVELLAAAALAPGAVVPVTIRLDTRHEPDVTARTYILRGRTGDGRPAEGAFSLVPPVDPKLATSFDPIEDEELEARIVRARQQLGKDLVTAEDLARIDGALAPGAGGS